MRLFASSSDFVFETNKSVFVAFVQSSPLATQPIFCSFDVRMSAAPTAAAATASKPGTATAAGNDWSEYKELKSSTGHAGLINQGATCYLNSLLQSMYWTPELRKALYEWRFVPKASATTPAAVALARSRSITAQLQSLFAQLGLSARCAVSSVALTKSFGWSADDVKRQHDVQELFHVYVLSIRFPGFVTTHSSHGLTNRFM